jgi:hypothetical protein
MTAKRRRVEEILMAGLRPSKLLVIALAGAVLLIVAIWAAVRLRSSPDNAVGPNPSPSGLAFFEIGEQTVFTEKIREKLREHLGSDAIERSTPLDLTFGDPRFLARHFPELQRLHQGFNDQAGARVEHDVFQLTYRYPDREKNNPFDYVRLVFSSATQHPLLVRITSKREGGVVVDTLKSKYGEPTVLPGEGDLAGGSYWRIDDNVLIARDIPDRAGRLETQITIYFVANLKALFDQEAAARKAREAKRERAVEGVF